MALLKMIYRQGKVTQIGRNVIDLRLAVSLTDKRWKLSCPCDDTVDYFRLDVIVRCRIICGKTRSSIEQVISPNTFQDFTITDFSEIFVTWLH